MRESGWSLYAITLKKGVREYKGNFLQLEEGDILVIEGTTIAWNDDRLSCTPFRQTANLKFTSAP